MASLIAAIADAYDAEEVDMIELAELSWDPRRVEENMRETARHAVPTVASKPKPMPRERFYRPNPTNRFIMAPSRPLGKPQYKIGEDPNDEPKPLPQSPRT
jgi:hypothetical protein